MTEKKSIPLGSQLKLLEARIDRKEINPDSKPPWKLLLDGTLHQKPQRETKDDATIVYDSNIPDVPTDVHEAMKRQKYLQEWMANGGTYEEFLKRFGPIQ